MPNSSNSSNSSNPPKILFMCKDAPWISSGYGIIAKHLLPRLAKRYGKDNILIFTPIYVRDYQTVWHGMKVLPGISFDYGDNMIRSHWENEQPTFVLHVGDWFQLRELPKLASEDKLLWVTWGPYDYLKIPESLVSSTIRFAWKIVPWTEYSRTKFLSHKLGNVTYPIPLGIDPTIWSPLDRTLYPRTMKSLGFAESTYNLMLIAANQRRKYIAEQLQGIALFRQEHPDKQPRLYLHTHMEGDIDLHQVVDAFGLSDITVWPDQYTMSLGGISEEQMALAMNCADVVLNCTLEGFGLAQVQAQALGLPVITLSEGPGTEIVRYGIEVGTMSVDYTQVATKPIPEPIGIATALERLYEVRGQRDEPAIQYTREHYSWDVIAGQWFKLIEELMQERDKYSLYQPVPSARLRRLAAKVTEVPSCLDVA